MLFAAGAGTHAKLDEHVAGFEFLLEQVAHLRERSHRVGRAVKNEHTAGQRAGLVLTKVSALALKFVSTVGVRHSLFELIPVELCAGEVFHEGDETLNLVDEVVVAAVVATEREVERIARNLEDTLHVRINDAGGVAGNGGVNESVRMYAILIFKSGAEVSLAQTAGRGRDITLSGVDELTGQGRVRGQTGRYRGKPGCSRKRR